MRLHTLNETINYQGLKTHLLPPSPPRQQGNRDARYWIHKIHSQILTGNSQLATALREGHFTFWQVLQAVRLDRCLNAGEHDLGATYLEQTLATAVTDIVPPNQINHVRHLLGLDPLE